ncbi:TPA: hypothetical protein ACH3X1_015055 [Trebouxia sp. C0004]
MHRLAKLADQGRAQPKQPVTRRQHAGRKGARKKAEINESEPSGSELGNVDEIEDTRARRKTEMGQPVCHNEVCNSSHDCEGFLKAISEDQKVSRA